MYESMLLPTDGNRDIAPVVDHAVALAKLFDATLHVLHVVDERAYLTIPPDARDRIRDILKADGESFTKTIAERAINENITVHRDLRWGDPATGILTAAVEHDIDLIVMGTHGRTGYERYALGSVAERVVRSAPIPVLTVAIGDTDQQTDDIQTALATRSVPPEDTGLDDRTNHDTPEETPHG